MEHQTVRSAQKQSFLRGHFPGNGPVGFFAWRRLIMRNVLKRFAGIAFAGVISLLGGSLRADDSFPPCWRGASGTTFANWNFTTSNNPALPEQFTNPNGMPQATLTIGTAGTGWRASVLSRTNVWDLGRGGFASVPIANFGGATNSWKYVQVQVTYFEDGGIYVAPSVAIAGATFISSQVVNNQTAFPGAWKTMQTVWRIQPAPAAETIQITGNPAKGLLLDQIIVDTRCSFPGGDVPGFQPCWRGQPGSTFEQWTFGVSNNPAAIPPEFVTNSYGAPLASIVLGPFSSGYVLENSFLGCVQGIWDLGRSGTLSLNVSNNPSASAGSYKYLQLQVTQYRDSIYNTNATVAVTGGTLVGRQQQTVLATSNVLSGIWITEQTVWRLGPPSPSVETVVITGGTNGSLIDQVVVDTIVLDFPCPSDQLLSANSGQCSRSNVTWSVPVVDGCLVTNVVSTPANGSTFPVGTNPVSVVISDIAGGTKTCNFNIVVTDNEAPTVVCPADITVSKSPTNCGAFVNFTPGAFDNCGAVTVSAIPPSGSLFPPGVTTVTCVAHDAAGNASAPCTFHVRVIDFGGDATAYQPCWRYVSGSTFQEWAFSISNNPAVVPAELVSNIYGAPLCSIVTGPFTSGYTDQNPFLGCVQGIWDLGRSGTMTLTVSNNPAAPVGSYKYLLLQVTQYRDSIYNTNATVAVSGGTLVGQQQQTVLVTSNVLSGIWITEQTVWRLGPPSPGVETVAITGGTNGSLIDQVVVDTMVLNFPCPSDQLLTANSGQCSRSNVTWSVPVVDGCLVTNVVSTPPNGSTFPVGTNLVSVVISDFEGGAKTCNFNVVVTDNEPPVARCTNIVVNLDTLGSATITGADVDNGSTDNCGIASRTVTPSLFTCANAGPNPVLLTVVDIHGNSNSCAATVFVQDVLPPIIVCPTNIVVAAAPGACFSNVTFSVGATDNCGVSNVVSVPPSGAAFPVGVTMVTNTATDIHGNTSVCTFTIRVVDDQPPAITCPSNIVVTAATGQCFSNVIFSVGAADNCGISNVVSIPASGTAFLVGVTTVTNSATDIHGNSSTCVFTVTVIDVEPPVITCPTNIIVSASSGQCSSNVIFSVGVTDNCGISNLVSMPASGAAFLVGVTSVTNTATDIHGNTSTCTFTVTVVDEEPPVISCPANIVVAAAPGLCISNVSFSVGATDNCGISNLVSVPAGGSPFPVGVTTVTNTTMDIHGNSSICTFTVTVLDEEPPVIDCPANIVVSAAAGQCVSNVTFSVGATDNCGISNIVSVPASGTAFPVGVTTVTNIATDVHGNSSLCAFTVTVIDEEPPAITCPTNMVVSAALSQCLSNVTFSVGATDNCGISNLVSVPASGTPFPVGLTTVTNTATDIHGNTSTCTFTVTVVDEEAPVITCPTNIIVAAAPGQCLSNVVFSVGATDNCGISNVVSVPASGAAFPVGTTTVTNTATDIHGNSSTCTFTVTVLDEEPPAIICPSNIVVLAANGQCLSNVVFSVGATDNCGISNVVSVPASGAAFPVGISTVTNVATDVHGNSSTCMFTVTVVDEEAPVITCPTNIVVTTAGGLCLSNVTFTLGATDNCGISNVVSVPASGTAFPVGVTTVANTATDKHGNSSTCAFTVTVLDLEPPAMSCPANITVNAAPGQCLSNVVFSIGATDNCGISNVVSIPASGTAFPVGVTTVANTATDIHGNVSTCTFTVTVLDEELPTIVCPANIVVTAAPGQCVSNVIFTVGATDNCGISNIVSMPASGAAFPVGVTTVSNIVTDIHGNSATCAFTVTVMDEEAPVIACPTNILVTSATGLCLSNVTFTVGATDNCGISNIVSVPASGAGFPVGVTTVTNTATDIHGNASTCTFTVTVTDAEAPVITCPANIVVNAAAGRCFSNVVFSVGATDNCGVSNVVSAPASGAAFPVGVTTVTNTATDIHGNISTCTFTVTVLDEELPVIVCPANIVVVSAPGQCVSNVTFTVGATDNCGISNIVSVPASGAAFPVGMTTVTNTATDIHGNSSTCMFTVTVMDEEAPVISCPTNIVVTSAAGLCLSNVTFMVGATDNCGISNVVSMPASGTAFAVGVTTVTNTATDIHGNSSSCNFTVTVVDLEPPMITCPANVVVSTAPGQCQSNVVFSVGATDNCGLSNLVSVPASGSAFLAGVTTVTNTATDIHGNISTCTFTVTVIDEEPPSVLSVTASQAQADVGVVDVKNCANTVLQGTVNITVQASDYCSLMTPQVNLTNGLFSATAVFIGESPAGYFNYEWNVTSNTANGTWVATAVATDGANVTTSSLNLCLNKAQVTGKVEMDTLRFGVPATYSFNRVVVFTATDNGGVPLKTWNTTVTFTNRILTGLADGTYILTDVPVNAARLSAKTSWSLRRRQTLSLDINYQSELNFDGANKLLGGDLTGNNVVNLGDYNVLATNWLVPAPVADINGDGIVNLADYNILGTYWFLVGDPP